MNLAKRLFGLLAASFLAVAGAVTLNAGHASALGPGSACVFLKPDGAAFSDPNFGISFGHVGWGYLIGGTDQWIYGATEDPTGAYSISPGSYNGMWWRQGNRSAMVDAFTRQPYWSYPGDPSRRPITAYTRYKCHYVANSAVGAANTARDQAMQAGYTGLGNNCMDHAYRILSAYNTGPDLPNPSFNWQPRDWYNALSNGWSERRVNAETWFNPANGLAMDLRSSSWSNGAAIQEYGWNGTYAQWWVRLPQQGGYYSLHNVLTGKCLDVPYGSTVPGTLLQQWSCNGGNNQMWAWDYKGWYNNGYPVYQIRARHDGECVDIPFGSSIPTTQLDQWTCNGGGNQEWY